MGSVANGSTFLFTSESVGEGHPDKIAYVEPQFQLAHTFHVLLTIFPQ